MDHGIRPVDPASNPDLVGLPGVDRRRDRRGGLAGDRKDSRDLRGAYLRNGPNPKFPPPGSYAYPLDGDGMIHGVWLNDGRARYRSRYVLTSGRQAEIRADRALWGGLMPPDELAGPDRDPDGFKSTPGINIIRHAHRSPTAG